MDPGQQSPGTDEVLVGLQGRGDDTRDVTGSLELGDAGKAVKGLWVALVLRQHLAERLGSLRRVVALHEQVAHCNASPVVTGSGGHCFVERTQRVMGQLEVPP